MDSTSYEKALSELQTNLVALQEWVKREKLKVVIVFEGRDASGKGGVIKRITEKINIKAPLRQAAYILHSTEQASFSAEFLC